jgi:PTS system N-acetylglucosamine-specific IIC component
MHLEKEDVSLMQKQAEKVLLFVGGRENIKDVDACITRLRLELFDDIQINENGLKSIGAAGILRLGNGKIQIVFGVYSEQLKVEIEKLLNSA